MSTNHITRIIPVIKVNNRNLNQDFYVKTLGMKSLLEEAALLSLGDQTKTEKLILEESPSMRSRRVKGPKKLSRLIIKVQEPKEIEALLAQKPECLKLYRGKVGYAFEALSPEGDRILLHAETEVSSLKEVAEVPLFKKQEDFIGLSQFDVEVLELHVSDVEKAEAFYQKIDNACDFLVFKEAFGPDLSVSNEKTWDLAMLKCKLVTLDTNLLKEVFQNQEIFIPKSDKFLLSQDPNKIELWFEA